MPYQLGDPAMCESLSHFAVAIQGLLFCFSLFVFLPLVSSLWREDTTQLFSRFDFFSLSWSGRYLYHGAFAPFVCWQLSPRWNQVIFRSLFLRSVAMLSRTLGEAQTVLLCVVLLSWFRFYSLLIILISLRAIKKPRMLWCRRGFRYRQIYLYIHWCFRLVLCRSNWLPLLLSPLSALRA